MPTYEIQFGAMQRTSKPTESRQKAKFEVPGQQWVDLSESKFGVSLLHDCKYGFDASNNTLRMTLLRSPHYPHALEPWRLNDDRFTDQGEHSFTSSLYPHHDDWREAETTRRARELNQPLLTVEGTTAQIPSIVSISSPGIVVDSIKKAEDNDEIITITETGRNQYRMVYVAGEDASQYEVHAVRLDGRLFLDLLPDKELLEERLQGEAYIPLIPGHFFLRAVLEPERLELTAMVDEAIQKKLDRGEIEISAVNWSDGLLLTAQTDDIQGLVVRCADDPEVWSGPTLYHRCRE